LSERNDKRFRAGEACQRQEAGKIPSAKYRSVYRVIMDWLFTYFCLISLAALLPSDVCAVLRARLIPSHVGGVRRNRRQSSVKHWVFQPLALLSKHIFSTVAPLAFWGNGTPIGMKCDPRSLFLLGRRPVLVRVAAPRFAMERPQINGVRVSVPLFEKIQGGPPPPLR